MGGNIASISHARHNYFTWRRLVYAVVALLLFAGAGGWHVLTAAPTFNVPSIAALPAYKDPELLARAWKLPAAVTYDQPILAQSNPSVCSAASLANVLHSFGQTGASESALVKQSGSCTFGICLNGLTLDELAELARSQSALRVAVVRDITLAQFRTYLISTNDPAHRAIVNFQRGLLFGKGGGHFSPIGGYLETEDLVLVLDVNADFGAWLVPSERLYQAVDALDDSSHQKRGLLILE